MATFYFYFDKNYISSSLGPVFRDWPLYLAVTKPNISYTQSVDLFDIYIVQCLNFQSFAFECGKII